LTRLDDKKPLNRCLTVNATAVSTVAARFGVFKPPANDMLFFAGF